MLKKVLISSCLFLTACSTPNVVVQKPVQINTPLPSKVEPISLHLEVVDVNGVKKYAITKEEFVILNKFLLEISEFIEKSNSVIKFYRKK